MKNKDLFKYYLSRMSEDEIDNKNTFHYTKRYAFMRKECEKCGMDIQEAEKTFNRFKNRHNQHNVRINSDIRIYDLFIHNRDDILTEQLFFLCDLEKTQVVEMMKIDEKYLYNQKWHLIIAYYLYSAINDYSMHKTGKKLINIASLDWEKEIVSWTPKGNGRYGIKDPVLLLWMIEAADVEVPEQITTFIKEIEEADCKHANKETDRIFLEKFKEADADNKLWDKLARKICE